MSPRPPNHQAIPALAEALSKDIAYSIPENYMLGAGDTYFSGKMLAKLGRIIVIAQELRGLAESDDVPDTSTADGKELYHIIQASKKAKLPSEDDVTKAVDRLRQGVEVWLNGTALAPFTFDSNWGGIVNCGCLFNGEGCDNVFPSCPSYTGEYSHVRFILPSSSWFSHSVHYINNNLKHEYSDPGLNFGQGFYNDHVSYLF